MCNEEDTMPVNDRSTDRPNMVVGKFEVHWTDGRAITTVEEAETVAIVPERIEYSNEAPKIRQAMREIETARFGGLEDRLLELVWLRASQINGSRSLSGQANAAFAGSDDEQRLASLPAWRDVPFYSESERAALACSEAVTRFADYGVPVDVFSQAHKQFTDQELIYSPSQSFL
jgi:alkylhydroperoxidase family enzyme